MPRVRDIVDLILAAKSRHPLVYYIALVPCGVLVAVTIDWVVHGQGPGLWELLLGLVVAVLVDLSTSLYRSWSEVLATQEQHVDRIAQLSDDLGSIHRQLAFRTRAVEAGDRSAAYLRRVLEDRDFRGPLAKLMLSSETPHSVVYRGPHKRKKYLEDLQLFIEKTQRSYFTLQPGLPFFDANYWFFRSFDESIQDCVRVITHADAAAVLSDARAVKTLRRYAYEAGKHTRTLWIIQEQAQRAVRSLPAKSRAKLNDLPIDLLTAIGEGDVVVCDHRVVLSYVEHPRSDEAELRYYLAAPDTSRALDELVSQLAPRTPPLLDAVDELEVRDAAGPFRLRTFEEAVSADCRPYSQKQFTVCLQTIVENAARLRERVKRVRWVLKADAYGLGASQIAQALFEELHRSFAFESIKEAHDVRLALVNRFGAEADNCDVLIMEPIQPEQMKTLLEQHWSCFAWTREQLATLNRECGEILGSGGKVRVHLKVDIGLHRFGAPVSQLQELYRMARSFKHLEVVGVAAHHFSTAPDDRVEEVQALLDKELSRCLDGTPTPPVVHSRSSGSLSSPDARAWPIEYRIGGALYGVFPRMEARNALANRFGLRVAVRLTGRIEAFVKVQPGETVSYGGSTYSAEEEGVLGWMNLGYSDGIPPALTGHAVVLYRKVHCPIVGVVGMNFSAIDVTRPLMELDLPTRKSLLNGSITGAEEVLLIGGDDERNRLEYIGGLVGVPPYALLGGFGKSPWLRYLSSESRV